MVKHLDGLSGEFLPVSRSHTVANPVRQPLWFIPMYSLITALYQS